jgi:hypothetical protein
VSAPKPAPTMDGGPEAPAHNARREMCCKQSVVTALDDLERLRFVTRIRRIRQVQTPLGFITRQITNAYRMHEPASGLGLLATLVFATESSFCNPSAHVVESLHGEHVLNHESTLHRALRRLGELIESKKEAAAIAAAKGCSM